MTPLANASRLPLSEPVPSRRPWVVLFLILTVIAIAYAGVLRSEFLNWDDNELVLTNPRLHPASLENLLSFWRELNTCNQKLYSPLSYSVWWLVAAVAGVRPWAFHGLNLFLHVLNCLLVGMLIAQVLMQRGIRGDRLLASTATGVLLFGLHPIQVEAVAWVSGMNGVLTTTFVLGSLLCFCRYAGSGTALGVRPLLWACALLAAAGLCKPIAVVTPGIALSISLLLKPSSPRRMLTGIGSLLLVSIPFALIGVSVQSITIVAGLPDRMIIAADSFAFYVGKMLVPFPLLPDYGRIPPWVLEHWLDRPYWVVTPVLFVAAIVAFCSARRMPLAALGIMAAAILPVSGLVGFAYQAYSTVADRYAYMAMIGPAIMVAAGIACLPQVRATRLAITGLALGASMLTWHQVRNWRNCLTWDEHILNHRPDSVVGNMSLGELLWHIGKPDDALVCLDRATTSVASNGTAHLLKCRILLDTGQASTRV